MLKENDEWMHVEQLKAKLQERDFHISDVTIIELLFNYPHIFCDVSAVDSKFWTVCCLGMNPCYRKHSTDHLSILIEDDH